MFKKLFGKTENAQIKYLGWRSIISIAALLITLIVSLISGNWAIFILGFELPAIILWGWGVMKALFGFATISSVFANNIIFGILLFIGALIGSVFIGMFVELIGICRWIYLMVKSKASSGINN